MSVRMRHTKGHTANRRAQHALKEPRFSKCGECGAQHIRHQVCKNCGKYRGRLAVDVKAKTAKKEKRYKEKMKSLGKDSTKKKDDKHPDSERHDATKAGPLDAVAMSKRSHERVKKG